MSSKNFGKKRWWAVLIGRFIQWLMGGWRVRGDFPKQNKYVLIVAHHTSNWDFMVGYAVKLIYSLRCCFLAKKSLFVGPLGWFLRKVGGCPVERNSRHNQVEQAAQRIRQAKGFVLVVTPEGTRAKVKQWKTGFYHIARMAGVPILPVAFDFEHKEVVIGDMMKPTGRLDEDMRELHRFFRPFKPKYPELACHGPFE